MNISLTLGSVAALFGTMLILALVPSMSVITVSARSAAFGFAHGASTALGVVVGDVVFILIAILGLAAIAESVDWLLIGLRYFGGVYLVWLGIQLFRSRSSGCEDDSSATASLVSSFMAGFLLTLGDQKAILFYLVFFPAFVDISQLTSVDAAIIVGIAVISVGGAKLGYAFAADRVSLLPSESAQRVVSKAAAALLISVGVVLLLKS
jgi:threonine/homoserine/homoserine lactone efflux protein